MMVSSPLSECEAACMLNKVGDPCELKAIQSHKGAPVAVDCGITESP